MADPRPPEAAGLSDRHHEDMATSSEACPVDQCPAAVDSYPSTLDDNGGLSEPLSQSSGRERPTVTVPAVVARAIGVDPSSSEPTPIAPSPATIRAASPPPPMNAPAPQVARPVTQQQEPSVAPAARPFSHARNRSLTLPVRQKAMNRGMPPDPSQSNRPRASTVQAPSQDDIMAHMGSIRMGASALVSALTALPWESEGETEEEDFSGPIPTWMAQQGEQPPQRPKMSRLHSSLHTIKAMESPTSPPRELSPMSFSEPEPPSSSPPRHRPHRRLSFPYKENVITRRAREPHVNELAYQFAPEDGEVPRRVESSATLRAPTGSYGGESPDILERRVSPLGADDSQPSSEPDLSPEEEKRGRMEKLSSLLQEIFGLEDLEEVLEEFPCWLLRSEMLKGYMFLTRQHVCFYARIPETTEDTVIKSGPLWKKNKTTKLSTRFWFTLRNGILSWYESAKDPYFPKGNVSLQYASSCELVDDTRFKLRTSEKNYTFQSDTNTNAAEWVKMIQRVIQKTQNGGESLKVIIPWEAVVEVERSPTLEFAETIEVKVIDAEDAMSVDSYFFASFASNDYAYELLQTLFMERPNADLPQVVPEGEEPSTPSRPGSAGGAQAVFSRIGSVLRPASIAEGDSRVPIAPPRVSSLPEYSTDELASEPDSEVDSHTGSGQYHDPSKGGYPPQQRGPPPPGMAQAPPGWRQSWIPHPAGKLFGSTPPPPPPRGRARRKESVTEVVEPSVETTDDDLSEYEERHSRRSKTGLTHTSSGSLGKSMFSNVSSTGNIDDDVSRKFHSTFALPDKEILIDHFSGSLYRVLPVHGRFYISTNYFCFRSSYLIHKTKMVVPIRQLYGMKAQKAFRFGHYGLIVIIKGHEELFLEFHTADKRDECMRLLEERMDDLSEKVGAEKVLEDILPEQPVIGDIDGAVSPSPQASMFNSTSSSFLQFKPEPMTIVCLTIGSRGDVQPYIALCKGLQAEGHTCRIATHAEYQNWIEGHGIGFAAVGGDPAKLMEMCVDNGMFTIAFLKEGVAKFRGWLDDLLMDSWEACQGADLLIESPSAMAGIHVAEGLRIPYYRAFTMPWTRTRAYPQAFAVPEHKRGGTYNYMTYVMFDQVFWRAISGQVNRWRKNVMGLDSTTLDKLQQDKVPFLYNFSPMVVPPPLDWTEWIHVTGYWFLENADHAEDKDKEWEPPEGLVEFIDTAHAAGKKVVYIGFGSIVVSDPQEMTRCVVQGVVDSGVCAILSKGWSDRGSRGTKDTVKEDSDKAGADGIRYPPEIYSVDAIDHGWLFPRIDAACHHGGAGTTGASLRAGIPTIIKPFFGDQTFWAERVESLGVGAGLHKLTADALASALIEATTNERQIAKAKAVGQQIRQESGVQRAIESIYRDLEYARSLIKAPPKDKERDDSLMSIPSDVLSTLGKPVGSISRKLSRSSNALTSSSTPSSGHSRQPSTSSTKVQISVRETMEYHSQTYSSRGMSADREASDESWSVVSDNSEPGSRTHSRQPSESDSGFRIPVLGGLVGHILPHLSREKSRDRKS